MPSLAPRGLSDRLRRHMAPRPRDGHLKVFNMRVARYWPAGAHLQPGLRLLLRPIHRLPVGSPPHRLADAYVPRPVRRPAPVTIRLALR